MSTESESPTYPLPPYVYKILTTPTPAPLPDALPATELDLTDGFVHLSTAAQVPTTAALFFAAAHTLYLLKVDTAATRAAGGVYRWVAGLPGCPHLYAPDEGVPPALGHANVVGGAREVWRAEGQTWADALVGVREEGWLVDE